jgi:hypothetical protein
MSEQLDPTKVKPCLKEFAPGDLLELLEEAEVPDDVIQATMAEIKSRAEAVKMPFTEFVRAVENGEKPERSVPKVPWAQAGTDETVGAECREYLKRPDILKEMGLSFRIVEAVLKKLVEEDPALDDLDRGDNDVLQEVRTVWRRAYGRALRKKR